MCSRDFVSRSTGFVDLQNSGFFILGFESPGFRIFRNFALLNLKFLSLRYPTNLYIFFYFLFLLFSIFLFIFRYDKNDPVRGWKQITTGFRKWAERYTAYCRGEYVSKAFSKYATENLWRKTETAYRCRILGQDRQNCKPKKN